MDFIDKIVKSHLTKNKYFDKKGILKEKFIYVFLLSSKNTGGTILRWKEKNENSNIYFHAFRSIAISYVGKYFYKEEQIENVKKYENQYMFQLWVA